MASPSPAPVTVLHAAVPGRVRLAVAGLRRNGGMAGRLARSLTAQGWVRQVRINPRTGTVLLLVDPERRACEAAERVAALLAGAGEPGAGEPPSWHALTVAGAASRTGTDPARGLERAEACRRLSEVGHNRLPIPRRRSTTDILAGQMLTLPVGLLAASAVVSVITGGALDALAILAVIVLNGAIGTATEARTERLIARLEGMRRRTATVRRDGRTVTVDADEVVPGDVLVVTPGRTLAADVRLLEADGLLMDESVLTGESLPVAKTPPALFDPATPLAERSNMAWRGTLVAAGSGLGLAVATGARTEVGRIQALVGDVASPRTPLQGQLDRLGRRLAAASLLMCGGVFALGLLRGFGFAPLLRSVAALGVAALPEGLPTVATTALALAVRDLRRQGVLVRRLEVVESMGSAATVFFDKTGTLTLNRMSVARVEPGGAGAAERLWQVAVLCSDARLIPDAGGWRAEGTSTEAALVQAALSAGIDGASLRRSRPRLSERLRDDRRQSMATVHDMGRGLRLVAVKGSPAEVLASCSHRFDGGTSVLSQAGRERIAAANQAMASEGLRVLGFAYGEGEESQAGGLVWLGLVGLADPPRPGVRLFLDALHRSGIDTVMLTGDQAATARAIAIELGFCGDGVCPVADSGQIEGLAGAELADLARHTRVFARILPGHKLKVVQAYRQGGGVVAMVGDGVNDGPALKAADIGITMGRHGAQAARDLSDIVLENDDLSGLLTAIERGRATHDNIRKAVDFLVATNLAEIVATAGMTLLGRGHPLDPIHLLWVNLVTDVLPGLALSVEPAEPESLTRPPRDPDAPLLPPAGFARMAGEAAIIAAGVMSAHGAAAPGRAGTMGTTAMVAAQMLHAYTCRSRRRGLFIDGGSGGRAGNPWLRLATGGTLAIHGLALAIPALRRLLRFAPLSAADLAITGLAGLAPWLINEAAKAAAVSASRTRAPALRNRSPSGRLPSAS